MAENTELIALENVPVEIAESMRPILADMIEGMTLTKSCKKHGINSNTLWKWCDSYSELDAAIAHAHECWTHNRVDSLVDLVDSGYNPQLARIHSDNIKWIAARRNRKAYGDDAAKSSEVNSEIVSALRDAIERIPRPMSDLKIIDND